MDDPEEGFVCNHCFVQIQGVKEYFNHMDAIHRVFTCKDSTATKNQKDQFRRKSIRKFYDSVNMRNPRKRAFSKEEKEKYGIKDFFECVICALKFKSQNDVAVHSQDFHEFTSLQLEASYSTEEDRTCKDCGQIFRTYTAKISHIRDEIASIHDTTKNDHQFGYPCPVCLKTFRFRNSIQPHIRSIHTKKKDYNCTECGDRFCTAAQLSRHQEVVHEERRACPHCDKSFSIKYQLANHMANKHSDLSLKSQLRQYHTN